MSKQELAGGMIYPNQLADSGSVNQNWFGRFGPGSVNRN